MKLILHTPDSDSNLSVYYKKAFREAVELFIVTAYLTEWDKTFTLNPNCKRFRVIIGKDFGITRKAACETLMRCLPPERKGQFALVPKLQLGNQNP